MPFIAPHTPLDAPQELQDKYRDINIDLAPARAKQTDNTRRIAKILLQESARPMYAAVVDAMDQAIVWDVFTNLLDAATVLGKNDDPLIARVRQRRAQLAWPDIGADGRLMEWARPFGEAEPGHRHISHLFGLHPGAQFTRDITPQLLDAARKTLDFRLANGGGHTGWSRAWLVNMFARLGDGKAVEENLRALERGPLSDEEIFREQDRSMTWVYWKITVTPRLEMLTRAHQLDAAQQNETRALLVLRRSKFMALFDSTPHLGIRLSGLAPLIERVAATAAAR